MTNQQTIRVAYEKALHLILESSAICEEDASRIACDLVSIRMDNIQENVKALLDIMEETRT